VSFPAPELWTCRVYPPANSAGCIPRRQCRVYPPSAVQGVLFQDQNYGRAGCIPCRQCSVSFSSTRIMDVQGLCPTDSAGCPFLTPELWTCRVYPPPTVQGVLFQHQNYGCAGCVPPAASAGFPYPVPELWTCRVYPLPTVQSILFEHQNYGRAGSMPHRQCRVSFSNTRIMDL
jgi:hypothetical protein